jgi:hypothetical protein
MVEGGGLNMKDWIVIHGSILGEGFEFFGPFTEHEANLVRLKFIEDLEADHLYLTVAVQLLRTPVPVPEGDC